MVVQLTIPSDRSNRDNVLFIQDLIFLANLHNRPGTDMKELMDLLKRLTGN